MAPSGMVKVYPRRIDLQNVEKLRGFEARQVVETLTELEQRSRGLSMAERILFLTGHLAEPRLKR